jgi:hypothetical protein
MSAADATTDRSGHDTAAMEAEPATYRVLSPLLLIIVHFALDSAKTLCSICTCV